MSQPSCAIGGYSSAPTQSSDYRRTRPHSFHSIQNLRLPKRVTMDFCKMKRWLFLPNKAKAATFSCFTYHQPSTTRQSALNVSHFKATFVKSFLRACLVNYDVIPLIVKDYVRDLVWKHSLEYDLCQCVSWLCFVTHQIGETMLQFILYLSQTETSRHFPFGTMKRHLCVYSNMDASASSTMFHV